MAAPWIQNWVLGIKTLALHPMRSLLTVLGIFIGVASVVWLLAIGEGISAKAQEQIAGLGANNIIVRSIKPPDTVVSSGSSALVPYGLTRSDLNRLIATVPTIKQALPIRELPRQFSFADRSISGRLVGCTPPFAEVTQLNVREGHFITDAEVSENSNVCVLSAEVADTLFPVEDPLGQGIHIDEAYYVVVGVLWPRGQSAGIGGSLAAVDFTKDVYIPITTLWARLGDQIITRGSGSMSGEIVEINQITLRVDDVKNVIETSEIVRNTLRDYHRITDYGVTVPLELLQQAATTRLMFIVLLGFIAAISLVVGGIGIMNIMLATVTERTREIGIRRALGAKRKDITRQFLAETVVLSVVGGLTGILGGLTCRPIIVWLRSGMNYFYPEVMQTLPDVVRDVEPQIVGWSIPLSFFISVGVGVIFGLYPAIRAAAMDPIEALRHE